MRRALIGLAMIAGCAGHTPAPRQAPVQAPAYVVIAAPGERARLEARARRPAGTPATLVVDGVRTWADLPPDAIGMTYPGEPDPHELEPAAWDGCLAIARCS